jgi:septal ring factor EnvC (AmiA/AmiB activator)
MSPVRNTFFYPVSIACIVVYAFLSTGTVAYAARTAIVQVDRLNLRAKPDMQGRAIAVLVKNTRVAIIKSQDNWLKVKYKNKTGYLKNSKRYVKIISQKTPSTKTAQKITQTREKARTLEQKIKTSEAAMVSYTKKEAEVVRSLDQLERSLDRARKQVVATRSELVRMDRELAKNQLALEELEKQIAAAEAYAAVRLVALYKLNWLGRINILASAGSMGEMLQRERALSRILDQDEKHLAVLEHNYDRLEVLQEKQQKRKADKKSLENKYRLRVREMVAKKTRRSSVLTDIRSKKSLELAAIEVFKENAKNLDMTIRQLGRTADLEKKSAAKNMEALSRALQDSFTARKGLLKLPVKGKIKNSFGTYRNKKFNTKNFRSGIDISADRGEPVYSVFPGRVLYSSWFKGYGNMLIIDHGGHYYTVYAHVEEVFKKKGEVVEDNEVIATVGDTGLMAGPGLYFEVRYHGKPLDPAKWIKKG